MGGWGAPLGIDLHADGLSLSMLAVTALVGFGVSVHSAGYFQGEDSTRFWPLWLFLLTALNALFLSADIFNLYVTLEMMGLAAVALAAMPGGRDALSGAMRYLLATLLGSLAFLFGVALLYHRFGSVDIALLAMRVDASPAVWTAMGLMGAGLLLKTALFPLHFWLPSAHASAPAPVSALLSALVVKASFYILLRLWLEIFDAAGGGVEGLFGLLGAAAVLWGSLQALRQARLKLLVAYSTVAQIGYLFLAFPLVAAVGVSAWGAAVYLALSHSLAKAAMFLAAGNLLHFGGHDRIADLDRVVQRLPLTAAAFAMAGMSIMGLPPSGGFIGKWLLLEAALVQGRWDLAAVMILGGLLAAGLCFQGAGTCLHPGHRNARAENGSCKHGMGGAATRIRSDPAGLPGAFGVVVGGHRRSFWHLGGETMNWDAWIPLLVIASSLLPGLIIFGLAEHRVRLRTGLNLLGALVNLAMVSWMLWGVYHGHHYETTHGTVA